MVVEIGVPDLVVLEGAAVVGIGVPESEVLEGANVVRMMGVLHTSLANCHIVFQLHA